METYITKHSRLFLVALALAAPAWIHAQLAQTGVVATNAPASPAYQVVDSGPNFERWSKVTPTTNQLGIVSRTNSLVRLSAGMNRLANGVYVRSEPQLIITNGSIIGRGAQHDLQVSGNINTAGAVQIRIGGTQNTWLRAHPLCLAYETAETNITVAILQDSGAQLVGTNSDHSSQSVLFTNALGGAGVSVDIEYSYTKAGVAQSLIAHALPTPQQVGILAAPEAVKVVLTTELTQSPTPEIQERTWVSGGQTNHEQLLNFGGSMRMVSSRAYKAGGNRRVGVPVERRYEIIEGRSVITETLPYPTVAREITQQRPTQHASISTGTASKSRFASASSPWNPVREGTPVSAQVAKRILPPAPKTTSSPRRPVLTASLPGISRGYVLDWDFVEADSNFDTGNTCGTWVIEGGEFHVLTAVFHAGATIKLDPGSSLYVDGSFYFSDDADCSGSPTVMTSVNDGAHGDLIPWSCNAAGMGEYGPALAVSAADLPAARGSVVTYYAQPDIIANPSSVSTIIVTASDSEATKGTSDTGTFTITRLDGDWAAPLTVALSVGGTAQSGIDYSPIATSATVPAHSNSIVITNTPLGQNGAKWSCDVTLTLQNTPTNSYLVGLFSQARCKIFDPTATPPEPVASIPGLVSWWRAETNSLDTAGTNHGVSMDGGIGFASGKTGSAFIITNDDSAVFLYVPASIQLQNFSIETWARRSDTTHVSFSDGEDALLLSCGYSGFGFGIASSGQPLLSKIGSDSLLPNAVVADTNWHHLAITKTNSTVIFYVDAVAYPASCYGSTFATGIGTAIGAVGDPPHPNAFQGKIDEIAFYNRVLSADEIQAIYQADISGKFLDSDQDGLPDNWEIAYFGNLSQGANGDPDGDGLTNLQEYHLHSNPNQAAAADANGAVHLQVYTPLK